ncbi:alanine racemase [Profundibacter amoris]|uniref:alanine racemase n=1 Tax=Profundibacter amoris TaxID=2171755 RepID=UPI002B207B91|nr:alanine racemase [Profundibacter amoris]
MGSGNSTIDLDALTANRRVLDTLAVCETAAVVKADGYGLGIDRGAKALAKAGARRFSSLSLWKAPQCIRRLARSAVSS